VRSARLVANPGCYPTAAALALLPLLAGRRVRGAVIVDAKSGVSGAGRSPSAATHFSEVNENVKPYKLGEHRHTPEMEQTFAEAGSAVSVSMRLIDEPVTSTRCNSCVGGCACACAQVWPAHSSEPNAACTRQAPRRRVVFIGDSKCRLGAG